MNNKYVYSLFKHWVILLCQLWNIIGNFSFIHLLSIFKHQVKHGGESTEIRNDKLVPQCPYFGLKWLIQIIIFEKSPGNQDNIFNNEILKLNPVNYFLI